MKHTGALTLACCALLALGSAAASRSLLQNQCLTVASSTANGPCQAFLAWQDELPPGTPTDVQLQAFADAHKSQGPTKECCTAAGQLVTSRCQCDAQVQQYSGLYNLNPSSLITFARTAKIACGPAYIASGINPWCNGTAAAGR